MPIDPTRVPSRYLQAKLVPFQSLRMGRPNNTFEQAGVNELQRKLKFLEMFWETLPSKMLPQIGNSGLRQGYGPYDFGDDGPAKFFGNRTAVAVTRFQNQVDVDADGKAGMNTCQKLDTLVQAILRQGIHDLNEVSDLPA